MTVTAKPSPGGARQLTLEEYEREFAGRHLLHDVVSHWAHAKPQAIALINADRKQEVSWATFDQASTAFALQLIRLGFRPGDFLAMSLPLLTESIFLEYACFKIGVVPAPLDLRLPPAEVIRSVGLIQAKGYVFPGALPGAAFTELGRAVEKHCPCVRHFIHASPADTGIAGAQSLQRFAEQARALATGAAEAELVAGVRAAYQQAAGQVREEQAALVIFTTGSTGSPKPALLSHRGITCQNACFTTAFPFDQNTRILLNLPPSHVGCQTEVLMGTLFAGGAVVFLEIFDPARSLKAIEEHRVNFLGQIPAMFNLEWRLKDYEKYDLSSLQFIAYGGSAVSPAFAEKLAAMAPTVATGLGLTEASGFCTYLLRDAARASEIASSLGHDAPAYPLSIRKPLREDGAVGDELPDGELGHVCFRGPQTFLGYVNDPEATARTISSDGFLYTGDLGYREAGGLHLSGRAKWVMKPFGYQVFPGDVENHICALSEKVAACGVIGVEHPIISDAVVAFVEKRPGVELTVQELERHARALASYMRPRHYVLLEPGQLPLNRVVKTDYVRLQQMAREHIEKMKTAGQRV